MYKSREKRDLGQIKPEREHEMFVCCSKIVNSPTAPKLSTYDGTTEWKPYFIQFNYIAQKYMWNEREKLDKLIECLREKALKFFSSRPENVQSDFKLLCHKFKERFDKSEQPHIMRRQLQKTKQEVDETLEEFAERIEELSMEAYPDFPDFWRSTVTIDVFLRGCKEKRAALVTLDKDPETLDKAVQYMLNAITNQKLLLGQKKDIRRATLEDEVLPNIENTNIRIVQKTVPSLETRITALENDNKETKRLLKEILERMKATEVERESRSRSWSARQRSIQRSRSNSAERESQSICIKCGEEGHFARNCFHRQNRSSRFRSPSNVHGYLNSHELRK